MVFADSFPERRTVRKQLKLYGRNLRDFRYEDSPILHHDCSMPAAKSHPIGTLSVSIKRPSEAGQIFREVPEATHCGLVMSVGFQLVATNRSNPIEETCGAVQSTLLQTGCGGAHHARKGTLRSRLHNWQKGHRTKNRPHHEAAVGFD